MPAFGAYTGGLNIRARGVHDGVRRAVVPRAHAGRDGGFTRSMRRAACRTDQSFRNTTDANQPVASAISVVNRP